MGDFLEDTIVFFGRGTAAKKQTNKQKAAFWMIRTNSLINLIMLIPPAHLINDFSGIGLNSSSERRIFPWNRKTTRISEEVWAPLICSVFPRARLCCSPAVTTLSWEAEFAPKLAEINLVPMSLGWISQEKQILSDHPPLMQQNWDFMPGKKASAFSAACNLLWPN